jgi:glycosidase
MLNAQFDFNVYFTATRALIGDGDFVNVDRVIRESCATYGAHHTMGNISGNHDQVRFASVAGGGISLNEDGKEAGWTRKIGIVAENDMDNIEKIDQAYKRALLLEVINLTIPGVPCIYQGDEYAEVGGNDPDNRHMMRFDNLSDKEKQFRQEVQKLIKLRRESMPLLYGEYIPVEVSNDKLVFDRTYLGQTIRITIDREGLTYSIEYK